MKRESAQKSTERKLAFINNRYGTNHGADYLEILIAETTKAMALSQSLHMICEIKEKATTQGSS